MKRFPNFRNDVLREISKCVLKYLCPLWSLSCMTDRYLGFVNRAMALMLLASSFHPSSPSHLKSRFFFA